MTKKNKINIDKESLYPDEIMVIPNPEKKFHEKWYKNRNKLNFPHPYRILLCSIQPNLGKTNIIKNIIIRANPKFKEIFLYHCGGEEQKEYEDIDYECIDEIPPINSNVFNPNHKTLLIIEDKNFKYMSKNELHRLDRLLGFNSTHRNLSCCVASQSFFDVPCSVRRMSNIYVLWKNKDIDSMKTIGRRVGLKKEELYKLIMDNLHNVHDTLWLDCTKKTPYPIRKNGFEIINIK